MIFYFSCTGNTKWAAQKVAEATNDRFVDIVKCINDTSTTEPYTFCLEEGESVGFFFPVHGWRPPKLVRSFIANLRLEHLSADTYCYAVCTAGDNIGETMSIFDADLKASLGICTASCLSLIMPESYVGLPFMDVDTPASEQRKIIHAGEQLMSFVDDIRAHRHDVRKLTIGNWPKTNSRLIGSIFNRWIIGDSKFKVDAERCLKCGLCARNCPVKDITISKNGMPQWKHNGKCISCFACYHHCKSRAIEYGNRTKGKGQYFFGKNTLSVE